MQTAELIRLGLATAQAVTAAPGQATPQRTALSLASAVTAFVFALAGVGCGLAALWIATYPYLGPPGAALAVAAVLLVLSAVILIWLRDVPAPSRAPVASPAADLLGQAEQALREHKTSTLLAALLAGFVAGQAQK